MKRVPFALLAFVVIAPMFANPTARTVIFVSSCECIAFHGIHRWVAKTDLSRSGLSTGAALFFLAGATPVVAEPSQLMFVHAGEHSLHHE
jgi:hypothetical protein